ncbi:MAG: class I SAM-dependent methyltransferase [Thermodesulfobacteriota bacterium]
MTLAATTDDRFAPRARPPEAHAPRLDRGAFARLLGVREDELPEECAARIDRADLRYTPLTGEALEEVVERVVSTLDSPLAPSGPARQPAWQAGWGDILRRFRASGGDLAELEPHYFRRPSRTMRLEGRYVRPHDARFEASFVDVMHAFVARRWLGDAAAVFEFGCGPGHNLVALARLLPGVPLVGLDWAPASQELLAEVASLARLPIAARRFDMFAPDQGLELPAGTAVVTIGAMEQLGDGYAPFLGFLLERRPQICVHLEPIHELYDLQLPFDAVAARYAERRRYLRGYLPCLERLARRGEIELLCVRRHLGSELHDGWGSLVWRPRPSKGRR